MNPKILWRNKTFQNDTRVLFLDYLWMHNSKVSVFIYIPVHIVNMCTKMSCMIIDDDYETRSSECQQLQANMTSISDKSSKTAEYWSPCKLEINSDSSYRSAYLPKVKVCLNRSGWNHVQMAKRNVLQSQVIYLSIIQCKSTPNMQRSTVDYT